MQQNIPGSLQSGTPPSENKSTEQEAPTILEEELEVSDQIETPPPDDVPIEEIPTLEFSDDIGVSDKGTDQQATTTATAQEEQQLEGPSTYVRQDQNQETALQTTTEDLQETSLIVNIVNPLAKLVLPCFIKKIIMRFIMTIIINLKIEPDCIKIFLLFIDFMIS